MLPPRERAAATGRVPNMNATATVAPAGPQYMRALERANQVRLARAELKRRVATGEIEVAEVILDCPWEAESMAVADLLMSQRRWGQTRCRKFLVPDPDVREEDGRLDDRPSAPHAGGDAAAPPIGAARWSATPWVTDSLTRA